MYVGMIALSLRNFCFFGDQPFQLGFSFELLFRLHVYTRRPAFARFPPGFWSKFFPGGPRKGLLLLSRATSTRKCRTFRVHRQLFGAQANTLVAVSEYKDWNGFTKLRSDSPSLPLT
jgi:hypothetical protein